MGLEAGAIASIVGAVVAAGGASYSGYVANDNSIDAQKAADKRAGEEQAAALQDAANIRQKADRLKGMQRAGLAASGASLDGGTPETILGETDRLSEQDALAAIKEGSQRAQLIKDQGSLTAGNYKSQAIASTLGGVSTIMGGVTSYQNATKSGRIADTINLNVDDALANKGLTAAKPKYSIPTILGG